MIFSIEFTHRNVNPLFTVFFSLYEKLQALEDFYTAVIRHYKFDQ